MHRDEPEDMKADETVERRDGWVTRREGPTGKLIGAAAAIALLVLFVLQNTDEIRIEFLFWSGRWPAWIVILLVALLGIVVGWVAATLRGRRRRRET